MKNKYFILLLWGIVASLASCVNTKKYGTVWIPSNHSQCMYNVEISKPKVKAGSGTVSEPYHFLRTAHVLHGFVAQVKTDSDNNQLLITVIDSSNQQITCDTIKLPATHHPAGNSYFFPAQPDLLKAKWNHDTTFPCACRPKVRMRAYYSSCSFKYIEEQPLFLALTIPFKYRLPQGSTPYSAENSFDIALAWGWKTSFNNFHVFYSPDGTPLSSSTRKISFTGSAFCGPTVISLGPDNTSGSLSSPRSVAGLSAGLLAGLGVNHFSLGIAIGADFTMGSTESAWVYNRKPWIGLAVSLDLFGG